MKPDKMFELTGHAAREGETSASDGSSAETSLPDQRAAKDRLIRYEAQELAQIQEELEQARRKDSEASHKIDLLERENREILAVLESIQQSVAWKFVKRYRRVKNNLFPPGTHWRRFYDRWLSWLKGSRPASRFRMSTPHGKESQEEVPRASGGDVAHESFNEKDSPCRKPSIGAEASLERRPVPLCSIVIPVFSRAQFTKACLLAIEKSILADQIPYEVIVVDNGSTDETPELLSSWSGSRENARVIPMGRNAGFAGACNEGARQARGKYIVLLNNDTLPTPGWLQHMVRLAERGTQIGVVGSKLLFPNGRIQHIGVAFDEKKNPRHIYRGFCADIPPAKISREYQAVTGACLLVARNLYLSAGGMDETYENSFEDVDFCLKVRAHGYRVFVCADSVVYHFESVSEGRHASDFRNSARFKSRWENSVNCDNKRWHTVDNLGGDETEFEAHEGYDAGHESWLEDLWKRVYACPFPNGKM